MSNKALVLQNPCERGLIDASFDPALNRNLKCSLYFHIKKRKKKEITKITCPVSNKDMNDLAVGCYDCRRQKRQTQNKHLPTFSHCVIGAAFASPPLNVYARDQNPKKTPSDFPHFWSRRCIVGTGSQAHRWASTDRWTRAKRPNRCSSILGHTHKHAGGCLSATRE